MYVCSHQYVVIGIITDLLNLLKYRMVTNLLTCSKIKRFKSGQWVLYTQKDFSGNRKLLCKMEGYDMRHCYFQ